jgi:hypothetical protein
MFARNSEAQVKKLKHIVQYEVGEGSTWVGFDCT